MIAPTVCFGQITKYVCKPYDTTPGCGSFWTLSGSTLSPINSNYIISGNGSGLTNLNWNQMIGVPSGGYTATFTSSSLSAGVLTVTHNLGVQSVIVSVYDNGSNLIIPDGITLTSTSACTVNLSSYTITGTWKVVVQGGSLTNKVYTDSTLTGNGLAVTPLSVSLTSGMVTGALGFTPYNATNPNSYIPLMALSAGTGISYNNTTGVITNAALPGMSNVVTASPSSANTFSIGSLTSGVNYRIIVNLKQNTTAGQFNITFNSDSGSYYTWAWTENAMSSGGTSNDLVYGRVNTTYIADLDNNAIGEGFYIVMDFSTIPGSTSIVRGNMTYGITDSAGYFRTLHGTFKYSHNALSSIDFTTTAGTVTGTVNLYRMN
jgi:hypothetical protein